MVNRRLAYTAEQAAEQIGCSRAFIYKQIACGRLRSVKVGRARRILHDDLVAMLEAGADSRRSDDTGAAS
jgi:excisionase family DNA binding protein